MNARAGRGSPPADPAPQRIVLASPEALAEEAVQRTRAALGEAMARGGPASLVLAGGSTAVLFHRVLAQRVRSQPEEGLDWRRVHVFFGDERAVPPDDPASNYGSARVHLLEPLGLPPAQVHRIAGELGPEAAARAYELELERWLGAHGGFDVVLLGVGADGHTASLFPGSPALAERTRLCLATRSPSPPHGRITLTLPALARARTLLVLVVGRAKREALRRSLAPGPGDPAEPTPAARARPTRGPAVWLVDREAAGELEST